MQTNISPANKYITFPVQEYDLVGVPANLTR